jgi:hypothetical protein
LRSQEQQQNQEAQSEQRYKNPEIKPGLGTWIGKENRIRKDEYAESRERE